MTHPQRENFPSEGKSTQFSLGGKILPQKMFRVISVPLALRVLGVGVTGTALQDEPSKGAHQ